MEISQAVPPVPRRGARVPEESGRWVRILATTSPYANGALSLIAPSGRDTPGDARAIVIRNQTQSSSDPEAAPASEAVRVDPTDPPSNVDEEGAAGPAARTRALLAAIVDSSDDAIISKDLNGAITSWNHSAERLFGYRANEMIGKSIRLIIPEDRWEEEATILARLRRGERIDHFQTVRIRKNGEPVDVSLTISPIKDPSEKIIGASKVARDMTEELRLRRELLERNRELDAQRRRAEDSSRLESEFLASMSHELRTPLNSIIGFSELLLNSPDGDLRTEQREYLSDILRSGVHLLALIDQVLDVSMFESGKGRLAPEPFALAEAVSEVERTLRPEVERWGLTLRTVVGPGLETVVLDRIRFKQILLNLLANAVKFTHQGGRIAVVAQRTGPDRFTVRIEDTGIGIAPEDVPRLFRRFEQLDAGPGRRFPGSGLGLYVTKRWVELHGGGIEVQSQVGMGTIFSVDLPLSVGAQGDAAAGGPS
jgi:PAS domain S-box-containing protein